MKFEKDKVPTECRIDAAFTCLTRRTYDKSKLKSVNKYLKSIVNISDLNFIFRHAYKFGAKRYKHVKYNLMQLFEALQYTSA